jgi:hypothetical protein
MPSCVLRAARTVLVLLWCLYLLHFVTKYYKILQNVVGYDSGSHGGEFEDGRLLGCSGV